MLDSSKKIALAVTVLASALVALPGVRHALPKAYRGKDSFPISTFPMFSRPRPREKRIAFVRALDAHGAVLGRVRSGIFDPGGMNQALGHLYDLSGQKRARKRAACEDIARKVAEHYDKPAAAIEVVDAYFEAVKVFGPERDETPARERVVVRCDVPLLPSGASR